METERLKHFCLIAELGSMSKAAEMIGITHSGLSKAISALESETKLQLFTPQGRGIEITKQGKWFYQKAQEILKVTNEIDNGTIKTENKTVIGLSSILSMSCASQIVNELDTQITIFETDVGDIEEKIIEGTADYGIVFIPQPRHDVDYLKLGEVHFSGYAREDLLKKHDSDKVPYAVPTSDLSSNPQGYKSRDGWPREIPRNSQFYVSNFSIALNLLRSGTAAVYMPHFVARLENSDRDKNLKIVKVGEKGTTSVRSLWLVKSKTVPETREMKKIAKIIRQVCLSSNMI